MADYSLVSSCMVQCIDYFQFDAGRSFLSRNYGDVSRNRHGGDVSRNRHSGDVNRIRHSISHHNGGGTFHGNHRQYNDDNHLWCPKIRLNNHHHRRDYRNNGQNGDYGQIFLFHDDHCDQYNRLHTWALQQGQVAP